MSQSPQGRVATRVGQVNLCTVGVTNAVLRSRYLDLRGFGALCVAIRRPYHVSEVLLACEELSCGPQRFALWERLFALEADAGCLQPDTDITRKVKRRQPRFENLSFGREGVGPDVASDGLSLSIPHGEETGDSDAVGSCTASSTLANVIDDDEEDMRLEYERYLQYAEVFCQSSKLSSGQSGEIVRDVIRTLPNHPFFSTDMSLPSRLSASLNDTGGRESILMARTSKENGCLMLGRILQAVATACPQVGYCQGMNFVAATLLLCALPEEISGGADDEKARLRIIERSAASSGTMWKLAMKDLLDGDGVHHEGDHDAEESSDDDDRFAAEPRRRGSSTVDRNVFSDEPSTLSDTVNQQQKEQENKEQQQSMLSKQERCAVEFRVYCFICRLIHKCGKFGMIGMWQAGTPMMKMRVFQLDSIMTWRLPKLRAHFERIQMQPEILVSQWFMTLFSYTMPMGLTLRLWDYIIHGGWPAIFQVTIALLVTMEHRMRALDLDGIGKLMRDWKRTGNDLLQQQDAAGIETILRIAAETQITSENLKKLTENYALDMLDMSERIVTAAKEGQEAEAEAEVSVKHSVFKGVLGQTNALLERALSPGGVRPNASVTTTPSQEKPRLQQLQLSNDEATEWLVRYGWVLTIEKAEDMLNASKELNQIDDEADHDKQSIQLKIVRASDACRHADKEIQDADIMMLHLMEKVERL